MFCDVCTFKRTIQQPPTGLTNDQKSIYNHANAHSRDAAVCVLFGSVPNPLRTEPTADPAISISDQPLHFKELDS